MTERTETKYGDRLTDHEWENDDAAEPVDRTSVSGHTLEVYYDTEPEPADNYGCKKYSATVRYDDDGPHVLYVVEHRWKGNYWRDVTDWDWQDIPDPVRAQIAAALPVDQPSDLDRGVRLIDEGGESRWEKHHKHRVDELSGDEMWGLSYLRDALGNLETAAEAFDDGSRGERLADKLVTLTQRTITTLDARPTDSEADQ